MACPYYVMTLSVKNREKMLFKVCAGDLCGQHSIFCHRNVACLLTDHNTQGIGRLAHAKRSSVTQAEMLRQIHVMTNREDAPYRDYTSSRYYHGSIMKRGILEEYVFNQAGIDACVYDVAGALIVIKRNFPLETDQSTGF